MDLRPYCLVGAGNARFLFHLTIKESEGMDRREAHRQSQRLRGVGRVLRSTRSPHGAPWAAARCTRQLWSGPRDRDTGTAPPIKTTVAGPYLRAPRVRLIVAEGRNSKAVCPCANCVNLFATTRGRACGAQTRGPHPLHFKERL
jgi:hypothetical protein